MKRRTFIKRSSAASVPVLLGGVKVSALDNPFFEVLNTDSDRILVLIELTGGNDGLNMLIPKDQYANLAQVRSNVLVPENSILDMTDTIGLHPVMQELKNVHDDGKLAVIQGVAYPNQNRSHFRSIDIWTSGSDADQILTTGWLGRFFNLTHADYPNGYPNGDYPDPFAITVGSQVSPTCEGVGGNFSTALADPENLTALATPINGDLPDSCHGDQIQFLVDTIVQTNAYNDSIQSANDNGANLSNKYDNNNTLANKLKVVARLIAGGLKTKVYVVSIGGFDTHAIQVDETDTTLGIHADLLRELSEAICAFQDDLKLLGVEQRVLGMTYSEFGRRIRSNNSFGTDHGTAAPMMLFGACVHPVVIGDNPEISPDAGVQDGVPMQYDFRSVYGTVLMDWFGVEEQIVKDLLFDDFQHLPILSTCDNITPTDEILKTGALVLGIFPNPFTDHTTIEFTVKSGWVKISVFDAIGSEVKVLTSQQFTAGTHQIQMESHNLAAGHYSCRIQTDYGQKTKRLVKVR
ncbi:MAG: DUF1501 domain-containing protein [Bacteroidota bacterium]